MTWGHAMNTTLSKVNVSTEGQAIRVAPDGSLVVPRRPCTH